MYSLRMSDVCAELQASARRDAKIKKEEATQLVRRAKEAAREQRRENERARKARAAERRSNAAQKRADKERRIEFLIRGAHAAQWRGIMLELVNSRADGFQCLECRVFADGCVAWTGGKCAACHAAGDEEAVAREAHLKRLVQACAHRAKGADLPFDLTVDDLKRICDAQGGRCPYTGRRLKFKTTPAFRPLHSANIDVASVDQVVPSAGYVSDNVQLVTRICNVNKLDADRADFVQMCRDVARFRR